MRKASHIMTNFQQVPPRAYRRRVNKYPKNIPAGNTDALKRQLGSLEEEQTRIARQLDELNFESSADWFGPTLRSHYPDLAKSGHPGAPGDPS